LATSSASSPPSPKNTRSCRAPRSRDMRGKARDDLRSDSLSLAQGRQEATRSLAWRHRARILSDHIRYT
jgi:hypothetical protein